MFSLLFLDLRLKMFLFHFHIKAKLSKKVKSQMLQSVNRSSLCKHLFTELQQTHSAAFFFFLQRQQSLSTTTAGHGGVTTELTMS